MVTDTAVRWIAKHAPQVLFVHLAGVDVTGHAQGWASSAQLAAIATADRCIGRLLEALRRRRLLDSTVVLVTSDHGGAGRTHGPDDPRSREIPWIIAGPGIRGNLDLTTDADLDIRTEDTFATLCYLLGIDVPQPIDGRPVTQILIDEPAADGVGRTAK
jgi:arylsulfatase A-like enzyme